MNLLKRLWFLPAWLALAGNLPAAAENFYEAVVPVKERSDAAHAAALKQGLEQVLVKLAGSRKVLDQAALKKQLGRADKLVEQYEYRNQPAPGSDSPLSLSVRFSGKGVEDLLNAAGVSPLGKDRPLVLVWLALATPSRQVFVNPDDTPEEARALQTLAAARGLPVLFPLFDLDDRRAVSVAQLGAGQQDAILQAAARYAPGAVLAGRLISGKNGWQAEWYLLQGQDRLAWKDQRAGVPELMQEAFAKLAETLALRTATAAPEQPVAGVDLLVENVAGAGAYARLQSYLASLEAVKSLTVQQVDGERVRLRLEAVGGRAGLAQALVQGRVLVPAQNAAPPPPAGEEAPMVYRLAR